MRLTMISQTPELACLSCVGEITATRLVPGSDLIAELLGDDAYTRRVLVDLSKATFIDSSGVSMLIEWQRRFFRNNGRIVLYSVPALLRKVLDTLKLMSVLSVADNEAAARQIALA